MSTDEARRRQLLERLLAGEIDRAAYYRLLQEMERPGAPVRQGAGTQSIGDRPTNVGGWTSGLTAGAALGDEFAPPPVKLAEGAMLDVFRIERCIGRGGMGEVWKAWDTVGERAIVIKVLPAELQRDVEELARVKESFQRIHALQHQHICPVYLLGHDPHLGYYLVMKFVEGVTLSGYRRAFVTRRKNFPSTEVVRVLQPVAQGLDYAHSRKLVHRDIKPQNVLISHDGSDVQIVDFGLVAEIRTSITRTSRIRMEISGTYPYMAPEQWKGQYQDGRTDQYALGVVAYELLTGRLPFDAPDEFVLRQCVLHEPVPELEDQPGYVNDALARAMAKPREERFASVGEFVQALATAPRGKATKSWSRRKTEREGNGAAPPGAGRAGGRGTAAQEEAVEPLFPPQTDPRAQRREPPVTPAAPPKRRSRKGRLFVLMLLLLAAYLYSQGYVLPEVQRLRTTAVSLAVSPDGGRLLAASDEQGFGYARSALVFDLKSGVSTRSLDGVEVPVRSLALSPDGRKVVAGCAGWPFRTPQVFGREEIDAGRYLRMWDMETGQLLLSMRGHTDAVDSVAFSPDVNWLVSGGSDRTVRRWNAHTGTEEWRAEQPDSVAAVAVSAEGDRVAVGGQDRMVRLLDAATGLPIGRGGVVSLPTNGHGSSLPPPTPLGIVNPEVGEHFQPIRAVAFVGKGKRLVVADDSGTIQLWDAEYGFQLMRTFVGHYKAVTSLSVSPDGHRLLSGSDDGTVRLWDVDTGRELRRFTHEGPVACVRFRPNHRHAIGSDTKGNVIVWRLPYDAFDVQ